MSSKNCAFIRIKYILTIIARHPKIFKLKNPYP